MSRYVSVPDESTEWWKDHEVNNKDADSTLDNGMYDKKHVMMLLSGSVSLFVLNFKKNYVLVPRHNLI